MTTYANRIRRLACRLTGDRWEVEDLERGLEDRGATSPLPGPDLDALARRENLQQAPDSLGPDCRVAILRVFQEGCSCREAAERLGVPLGTIPSRAHRARGELRQRLRQGHGVRGVLRRNDTGRGA